MKNRKMTQSEAEVQQDGKQEKVFTDENEANGSVAVSPGYSSVGHQKTQETVGDSAPVSDAVEQSEPPEWVLKILNVGKNFFSNHKIVGYCIMMAVVAFSFQLANYFISYFEDWLWDKWSRLEIPMALLLLMSVGMLRPFVGLSMTNRLSSIALAFRFLIGNPLFWLVREHLKLRVSEWVNQETSLIDKRILALAVLFVLNNYRMINRNSFTPFMLYSLWLFGGREALIVLNFPVEVGWRCVDLAFLFSNYNPPIRSAILSLKQMTIFPWWLVEPVFPSNLELSDSNGAHLEVVMTEAQSELMALVFSLRGLFKVSLFIVFVYLGSSFGVFAFARRCWTSRFKAISEMEKLITARDKAIEHAENNPFYAKLHSDPKEFLEADDGQDADVASSPREGGYLVSAKALRNDDFSPILSYGRDTLSSIKQAFTGNLEKRMSGRSRSEIGSSSTHQDRCTKLRSLISELYGKPDTFEKILRQSLIKIKRVENNEAANRGKSTIFCQASEQLARFPISRLKNGIDVRFENEHATGDGVASTLFNIIGEELAESAFHGEVQSLFRILPDSTLMLKSNEKVSKFEYYSLGRMIGVAILLDLIIPLPLSSAMLKIVVDEEIRSEDVLALDPEYYHNRILTLLKPGGVEIMKSFLDLDDIPFVWMDNNGQRGDELCENGCNRFLCEENKLEYIQLLSEHYLCGEVRKEMQTFLGGLYEVVPKRVFHESQVDFIDLALLLGGVSAIHVNDWNHNSHSNASTEAELMTVEYFWEAVTEMEEEQRTRLLQFCTGCSRLPPGGFANLKPKFSILLDSDTSHLPTARTCFNTLVLPVSPSKLDLKKKLDHICRYSTTFGEN